jgi:phosphoribosylanthranilate isomerase
MLIKICGIRSLAAARTAQEAGADLIGFVFAASRRQIDVASAASICRSVAGPGKVGVFVNQPLDEVNSIAEQCQLDYIQLHGDEPAEYRRSLNRPLIRAVRVGPGFNPAALETETANWLLLDSFVAGQQGGTGIVFDWQATRQLIGRLRQIFFVAGGLNVANVADAIRILRPDGIDVSGGVETGGTKDPDKIRQFIAAARTAERNHLC